MEGPALELLVLRRGLNSFDQHYNLLVEGVEMAGIDAYLPGFRHGADYLLK